MQVAPCSNQARTWLNTGSAVCALWNSLQDRSELVNQVSGPVEGQSDFSRTGLAGP